MHQAFPFGFTWSEGITHEDVNERRWRSDRARQPVRAAGAGKKSEVRPRQSDQVVAILSDTRSQASVNSNAPAKAVPEMAAMTGLGMVSQTAMALSKNPRCRSRHRATRDRKRAATLRGGSAQPLYSCLLRQLTSRFQRTAGTST